MLTTILSQQGRKIWYRGYVIHGEIPAVCYTVYGRKAERNLTELGITTCFRDAMEWIDRHINLMRNGWTLLQDTA